MVYRAYTHGNHIASCLIGFFLAVQVTHSSAWSSKAWTVLKKAGHKAASSHPAGLKVLQLQLQSRFGLKSLEALLISA